MVVFLLFSVIDSFEWFWMGSLHKNIQFMLEFLKTPFLVVHFSYYTLMTFLMILPVILLSSLFTQTICHKISPQTLNCLLMIHLFFPTVKNVNFCTDQLNSDLEKLSNWAHQWKMSFNPDPKKQAQEVIISRKRVKDCRSFFRN